MSGGATPLWRSSTRREARPGLPRSAWHVSLLLCTVSTADWYLQLSLFWIAAARGWSGVQLAGLVVAARAPTFVGGLLGGRLVDSVGPRRMFLLDGAVRGSILALLTVAAVGGADSYGVIAAGAAGSAVCAPLAYASARTAIPRLVGDAQLGRANTALSLSDQLPVVLSGMLAGPLLLWWKPAAFAVPALLMVLGIVLARSLPDGLRGPRPRGVTSEPPPVGRRTARRRLPVSVVALISLSTAYFLVYGPFQPLLPDLVRTNLGGDAGTYGAMRVFVGLGALLGLALAPWLCAFDRPGVVNALGAVVYGVVVFPLVLVHDIPAALAIYFLSGIVWGPYAAVEATAVHRWTPPDQHGRVFGIQRALTISAIPVGGAVASLASDHLSVSIILGASAIACVAAGLLGLLVPAIRRPAGPTATVATVPPPAVPAG